MKLKHSKNHLKSIQRVKIATLSRSCLTAFFNLAGKKAHTNLLDGTKDRPLIPKDNELAKLVVLNAHLSILHGGISWL